MKLAARVRRYLVLATLAAPVALLVHCGTTDDSLFDPNAGSACTGALAASCGAACAADEQCGAGTFCTGATCTAQCSVDAPCTDGLLCSPRGRCTPDGLDPAGGGTGFGGGGGGGGGSKDGAVSSDGGVFVPTGDACAAIDVTLAKVIPTIALLIDRSGSMSDPLGDAGTRWNVLREALIAPDGGLIKQLENDVRFGLALYTFSGSNNSASCPTITGQNLGFQLGNYGAIYNVYADAGVGSETPTGDSIDKLMGRVSDGGFTDAGFAALDAGGPKFILLATDGEPDRCELLNPNSRGGNPLAYTEALTATQSAFDAGVRTYIMAVGSDTSESYQREMANAGAGLDVDGGDAGFYTVTSKTQLEAALRSIIFGVRGCTFALQGAVIAGSEKFGSVKLDGAPLALNDPNGWRLNSPKEIELLGASCEAIKTGDRKVSVSFPCGTFTPPTGGGGGGGGGGPR